VRYTYTAYDENNYRIDTCTTKLEDVVKQVEERVSGFWHIDVTDNLKPQNTYILKSMVDIEEWRDTLARNAAWRPFDEQETGIHMKGVKSLDKVIGEGFGKLLAAGTVKLADNNLKTAAAIGKPQMSGIPPIAIMALGLAMQDGVNKYGRFNWREAAVTSSVFYDAMLRHLLAWYSGERTAPDSGVHHLAHLMAGAAILLDAEHNLVLNDDRKPGSLVNVHTADFIKDVVL
jgi:hypothetical protein